MGYGMFSRVVAVELIMAAGFKLTAPDSLENSLSLPIEHSGFAGAIIGIECCLGLGLLLGWQAQFFRGAAVLAFSLFALVAYRAHADGLGSCDCFGEVTISPRIILAFDLCLLLGFLAFKPRNGGGRFSFEVLFALLVALLCWLSILALGRGSLGAGFFVLRGQELAVVGGGVQFGTVEPGQTVTGALRIRNATAAAASLKSARANCGCLVAEGLPTVVSSACKGKRFHEIDGSI
jgi:hypothetical protein